MITFTDKVTVGLGDKKVKLIYDGSSHSNNSIAMHFPDEHTVFAVYIVSYQRVPFKGLGDSYFPVWIDALQVINGIYFDVLAPGQGKMGTKSMLDKTIRI